MRMLWFFLARNTLTTRESVRNTPLHWAALLGESQVVQFLIDQGADPCILNDFQKTPLDEAASKGHQSIVSLLEKLLESQGRADTSWLNQ